MSDVIPTGIIHPSGRATPVFGTDILVGPDGTPLRISDTFFFGRAATGNSPLRWDSSVINNSGFTLTVSNSLIEVPSAGKYVILVKMAAPGGVASTNRLRVNSVDQDIAVGNAGAGGIFTSPNLHVHNITTPSTQKIDVTATGISASATSNSIFIMKLT